MKTLLHVVLYMFLPLSFFAQDDKSTVESKAAAERAFDAVMSVDNEAPTNKEINEGLADALDDMIDNLDELKDAKKLKALRAMKKHVEDNLDGDPATVLDKAAKAAKKAVNSGDKIEDAGIDDYIDKVKSGLAKAAFELLASFDQGAMPQLGDHYSIAARGTGRTTGHIADLIVANKTDQTMVTQPQTFYIPSDGRFQSYVGSTSGGTVISPRGTVTEPVNGYCTEVETPPVQAGGDMSPEDWVTVTSPGIAVGAPVGIEPVVVGEDKPVVVINPVPGLPQDAFTPDDIIKIKQTPGFVESPRPESPGGEFTITFPGTDIPVGGTIDVDKNPEVFAPVIVRIVEEIESAIPVIRENPAHHTPFAGDPVKEAESIGQQVTWIVTSIIKGEPYKKDDFADNVYEQFEGSTGTPVSTLDEENKEQLDQGVTDFWNTFTAVGIEAKVLRETNPSPSDPDILIDVRRPRCECGDITFSLLIKRGPVDVIHSGTISLDDDDSPTIEVEDFELGNVFDIEISDIEVSCACDGATCEFYPAESQNAGSPGYTTPDIDRPGEVDIFISNDGRGAVSENSNCSQSEAAWDADAGKFTFKLTTSDENTTVSSVFQRLQIKAYCQLEDCRKKLCKETVQLNFVAADDDDE